MINGFHFLVFAAVIFGIVYVIPRAIKHDLVMRDLERLDDEELAAVLAEYPDYLDRVRKW